MRQNGRAESKRKGPPQVPKRFAPICRAACVIGFPSRPDSQSSTIRLVIGDQVPGDMSFYSGTELRVAEMIEISLPGTESVKRLAQVIWCRKYWDAGIFSLNALPYHGVIRLIADTEAERLSIIRILWTGKVA